MSASDPMAGAAPPPIPRATYRLQIHRGFDLHQARALVPYLDSLGISHVYCSPLFAARPGSTHGYDVVDHSRINPELGGPEALEAFSDALAERGMGLILDIVPNHVGVMGRSNPRWLDVLENGRASPYAQFFDIDWVPLKEELRGKVLLPVLGGQYGEVLDQGDLALVFDPEQGRLSVDYYEHRFPLDPRTYPQVLAPGLGYAGEGSAELDRMLAELRALPDRDSREPETIARRSQEKDALQERLADLCGRHPEVHRYVEACVAAFNGPDRTRLHQLLERQAHRPAYWRTAADEVNYRRFFDINDLAGLRMEQPEVFEATHALVLRLLAEGRVHGLRVDHPDGLCDPRAYTERLQARAAEVCQRSRDDPRTFYLVVEKILGSDEELPGDWPVHGTTGYDFAALLDGLQVDPDAREPLEAAYRAFVGESVPFEEELYRCKRLIIDTEISGELYVLASELNRITEADRHTRDYTFSGLMEALADIVACFPVYRSYVDSAGSSEADRRHIEQAVGAARRRSRMADTSVFGFIRDVLLLRHGHALGESYRSRLLAFTMKLQQYTGPVTAKGLEDTALYRYHRLTSLNEVGGAPQRFGVSVEEFHRRMMERRLHWPHSMLAGSTHDNKRSDDLRARLHVLSEIPEQWSAGVQQWARVNAPLKGRLEGEPVPEPNTEYLLYQTLVGCWPLEAPDARSLAELRDRVREYMLKAVREAKDRTSWVNSNEEYERLLAEFIEAVLDPERNSEFMTDFLPLVEQVARPGLLNALSRTLIRLTAPGVPDTYQGEELWGFSLVDPDNRRPVDYERRRALQATLAEAGPGELLAGLHDGRAKLYLMQRLLEHRRRSPDLFEQGDYLPLAAKGACAGHLCAFARRHGGRTLLSVAPRLVARLGGGAPLGRPAWQDTRLEVPGARWRDLVTDRVHTAERHGEAWVLELSRVLETFPVAALEQAEGAEP